MRKSTATRESIAPAPAARPRQSASLPVLEIGALKDQRNFKEKGFFTGAANQMLAFLEKRQFPHPINIKLLEQPNTGLVANIFKFLMIKSSPSYDMGTRRLEDEFPQAMLDLHYPYTLKSSHIRSASSHSSWPAVFGALYWMMENCDMNEMAEPVKQRDGKVWREYYTKKYEAFLHQKPVAPEVVEDMERVLTEELKAKKNKSMQYSARLDALNAQLAEFAIADNELVLLQQKIKDDSVQAVQLRQDIEEKRAEFIELEQLEAQSTDRLVQAEADWTDSTQKLDQLKDAIAQQVVDENVIVATRTALSKLKLEIGDVEQDIQEYLILIEDTKRDISAAKAPVDELMPQFRSTLNHLLSQLSRLNIAIDPGNLGMSMPSNPFEQISWFKNTIKPATMELSDTLSEECMKAKQKLREFVSHREELRSELDHLKRELEFLEAQNQRFLEEERRLVEREERRLYEWKTQEEEQAAKRRALIAELDARNMDVRHRIAAIDKEIENESMMLADKARTYEQVLLHISSTAAEAYKPVAENMLRLLTVVREAQKAEEELLRRGFETFDEHPLLRECLNEVLEERKLKTRSSEGSH